VTDSALFVAGAPSDNRYDASALRHFVAYLTRGRTGVWPSNSLAVSQHAGTPNMSVDVTRGTAIVIGSEVTDQGSYLQHISAAVTNQPIGVANGSNPRNDIVGVQIQDSGVSGSTNTDESNALQVIPGTPAGSPTDPTLPDNFCPLARVRVRAAATSVLNSDITDLRTFGALEDVIANQRARATFNGTVTMSNGARNIIPFDTETFDPHGDFNLSTHAYTCQATGVYEIRGLAVFGYNNARQLGALFVYINGAPTGDIRLDNNTWGTGLATNDACGLSGSELLECNSGDTLSLYLENDGTPNGNAVQLQRAVMSVRRVS